MSGGSLGVVRDQPTLAVLTVGQTPRIDVTPEIAALVPGVRIVEGGALDGLSRGQIAELRPEPGDETLVSRLNDGDFAVFGRSHVLPRIQALIEQFEVEVDAIMIACSGGFPELRHRGPLLLPDRLIVDALRSMIPSGARIGVLCPVPEQVDEVHEKYGAALSNVELEVAADSPYRSDAEALQRALQHFSARHVDAVILDCIGYGSEYKARVVSALGVPTVAARSLTARMAAEILCG